MSIQYYDKVNDPLFLEMKKIESLDTSHLLRANVQRIITLCHTLGKINGLNQREMCALMNLQTSTLCRSFKTNRASVTTLEKMRAFIITYYNVSAKWATAEIISQSGVNEDI